MCSLRSLAHAAALTLIALRAASGVSAEPPSADALRSVSDDLGRTVAVARPPLRIVSLTPGATEMLFAAGAGAQLIATVQYSSEPAAARAVPRIGDVAAIDLERLVALRPQVVIAWPAGGNPAQRAKIAALGIRSISNRWRASRTSRAHCGGWVCSRAPRRSPRVPRPPSRHGSPPSSAPTVPPLPLGPGRRCCCRYGTARSTPWAAGT